ncbi:ABC-2 type transport system ATP-binding protein [Marmoricola sp. OAE513]|uniref:ABC transporter ATP-binding protein n=1 Tax=Marmoricola sp. OAE513 TaxID=2817894 RepID=UPI001DC664FA
MARPDAPGTGLAIEVVDAGKVIDGVTVLDGVTFTAHPGRVTAFLGPNGAGKSSTLRAILGIDHLDTGHAHIGGKPFRDHARPLAVAGALLSPDAAHPTRSARGHLEVVAVSNGLPRSAVTAVIELVGLGDIVDLPFGQMSLGMRQRLGLATALIADPAVVILDEPHNGLDAAAIRWLRQVLRLLADAGRTVLLSSHLMGELEQIADDVVVIDAGRVVASGSLAAFVEGSSLEERYLATVSSA